MILHDLKGLEVTWKVIHQNYKFDVMRKKADDAVEAVPAIPP